MSGDLSSSVLSVLSSIKFSRKERSLSALAELIAVAPGVVHTQKVTSPLPGFNTVVHSRKHRSLPYISLSLFKNCCDIF